MKRYFTFMFLAATLSHVSCIVDSVGFGDDGNNPASKIAEVEISIDTGPSAAATRAEEEATSKLPNSGGRENTIGTLDLLIFETGGKFLYHREAQYVSTTTGTTESVYTAKLVETTAALDVHFLANCHDEMALFYDESDDIDPTQLYWNEIHAMLVDDAPEEIVDREKYLPMHGRLDDKTIPSNRWTEVVNLKRSVASFDVFVEKVAATSRFALQNVYVYRAPSLGYIGELRDGDRDNNHAANITTVLDSGEDDATTMSAGEVRMMYSEDEGTAYDAIACQMYVYENPYVTTGDDTRRPTRIIVAGLYEAGGVYTRYYWPIDILDAAGNNMAVERNHKYEFIITAVSGPGYATLREAQTGALRNFNGKTVELNDETVPVRTLKHWGANAIP